MSKLKWIYRLILTIKNIFYDMLTEKINGKVKWSISRILFFVCVIYFIYLIQRVTNKSFHPETEIEEGVFNTWLTWLSDLIVLLAIYVFGSKGWGFKDFQNPFVKNDNKTNQKTDNNSQSEEEKKASNII